MYQFWYDWIKPKYEEKPQLRYAETDSFIVYIKIKDVYTDIEKDVKTKSDISNYKVKRPLI